MFSIQITLLIGYLISVIFCLPGCGNKRDANSTRKPIDLIKQIPGKNDSIPAELATRGQVLIAYSDCYTCHNEDRKSVGPAFKDIAKRYPTNQDFIEMLAHKVIVGGSGSWGSPVMDSHPRLSFEDAKLMVTYILSMKK